MFAQTDLSELLKESDLQNSDKIRPLAIAVGMSNFVKQTLQKQPQLLQSWLAEYPSVENTGNYAMRLATVLEQVKDEAQLARELRLFRHREMATLNFLQSNKVACVEFVFEHLSDLAETLIIGARDWLFQRCCEEYGTPMNSLGEQQELLILGMGKLGGRELNFSSDIDLIFTYPDAGETVGGRKPIENSKFFTRLGQRLIKALDEITLDGFVYRTDMRLRPFGDSGALVLSFAAMEDYYQEQGRDWERYAMIKAKILGEDPQNINHRYLRQMLRPFMYRRYLDFSAIQSLREMKQKISREVLRRNLTDNIKLGAGGIREIEFIVQTFQMVRGGRDKILQERSLLRVLPRLAELKLLTEQQIQQLYDAYIFHRQVENVLQAIDDKQTQTLPTDEQDRARIMFACRSYLQKNAQNQPLVIENNIHTWQDFLQALEQHQQNVRAVFNQIIGEEGDDEASPLNEKLAVWQDILHYQISEEDLAAVLNDYPIDSNDYHEIFRQLSNTLQDWSKRPIGVRGRNVLQRLMPKILDMVCNREDYLVVLPRLLNIVDKITLRTTYLELLQEREQILPLLITLCSQSIMIAERIARYPMLLDELIIQNSLTQVIELNQYKTALNDYLIRIPEEDEEALIDALRQFKQSQILHIAAADILGVLPVMKISDHLTYLAEAIIGAVVNMAWKSLSQRFGMPDHLADAEQGFAVIAYGKLGGIELGYNSDLDLVFLHNAPQDSETTGARKSISSHQFYLKLAQKINSIFNLNTSAGVLYEVDMRLRPSGEAGLLVSTVSAYESYQQNEAWTWESQALVRTRCVYGSQELAQAFEQIRRATLAMPRTSGQLRREICEMRYKMYQHLSTSDHTHFDLKKDKGGITDIEFIAQCLVLEYAHQYPQMAIWSDNVRIFDSAVECGILSLTDGEMLKHCYTAIRNRIHHLNLLRSPSVVSADEFVEERAFVAQIWQRIFG
ncbi:bifunctional [glutamate--ammonia ligase]-adenylyl-L-tyrosine phosphorylase/[glutamate--ammonia-ligase] adenylyltransferase [Actinobacillus pleuropneumoniae]|uniref:Bifunctional glutamine synthetase adenylyltransferase/adenylyl-removing enzyme n=1 Tax=Actinobacillus pleuropneumoniae serotype 5b (strain L20) TaxID=416269 RepID=A3N0X7_ACTP2|nr:bifunctional [glutamate--ammonia ligase]-adenylyl-L-tyrosine phosphorylase/[glutamate--ammonia-ligase] adenylyltransferase [Actinobacillus pleuropneumoniae]ABN74063.1 glutamate-ammonia-ligase adenylyltransferase [Actinobacillus pleuropneumoniae serovar 5b str. L20]MEE3683866.1 bifunctional [glutamate--ammonia ligase]-adenylyl-L-tyrosine phosphorylase/[glutamate--ammonia-ligase] adenylyltransferase [Actinobacillus pleuropneumoniae]UKH10815.1 bifunctional [glutamate--ammonia ligase]-adenylyl-L-